MAQVSDFYREKKPFSAHLASNEGDIWPESFKNSAVNIEGHLECAVLILRQHFGENFTATDAIAVCKMIAEENNRLEKGK